MTSLDHSGLSSLSAHRYIPEAWRDKLETLPDAGRNEINNLNAELVHRLKVMDPAFSMGTINSYLFK